MGRWLLNVGTAVIAAALLGCSGPMVNVAPRTPVGQTEQLGVASGSACGMLLLGIIPIRLNSRTERAYDDALTSTGGTALMDTSITNRWFFALIGDVHCVDVDGIAVR